MNNEYESYLIQINCQICKKKFEPNYVHDKSYCKVGDHSYYTGKYRDGPHNIWKLK